MVLNKEKAAPEKKGDPKIAKGNANYKLPSINLLREGEGSHKLDENELKFRARAVGEKCHEFDVEGRVTQINPGPGLTTFEFKPEAGLTHGPLLGLTPDSHLPLLPHPSLTDPIP